MTASLTLASLRTTLNRRNLSLAGYAALVVVALACGVLWLADAFGAYGEIARAGDQQQAYERRLAAAPAVGRSTPVEAWISAKTMGLAGAILQERVETAAHRAGARTLSSRVDSAADDGAPNRIAYSGEFELDNGALQHLLYDLEAGSPLLFVDTLTIQAPRGAESGKSALHVSMGVVGQWKAAP